MVGMMWLDNSKADLAARVTKAAEYYRQKHGQAPNVCYVHAGQFTQIPVTVNAVAIVETIQVMPNHFWVGVREIVP